MFNEVVVVEGTHDMQKLQSIYPSIECIITGGSAISEETLLLIQQTSLTRGVILFLDPDYPGKQITQKILNYPGNYKIAFINREKAQSKNKKKIGIEHASESDIKDSLEQLFTIHKENQNPILMSDMMERKLINYPESKMKRNLICDKLKLPHCNGKTLLKIMNMLHLTTVQLDEVIE